jgi:SAM-dependent methyltransferase
MTQSAPRIFDRDLLTARRDRHATTAAQYDYLQQRVADDIVERLSIVRRSFAEALDLGAGHGVLGRRLKTAGAVGSIVAMEPAPRLLAQCEPPHVLADEEFLPFAPASFDLVVSGLALQWVNDLPGTLAQIRRCLRPDGLLLASLLGGESLRELREAWLVAEAEIEGGASPRVAPFADIRDLGGLLQRAGFALPVVDADVVRVTYPSPLALMRELKAMGLSNALTARRRMLLCRATLARAVEVYEKRHGLANGRIPATFEIITMTAWVPHDSQQKPLRPGSATARLADALGTTERSAGEPAGKKPT